MDKPLTEEEYKAIKNKYYKIFLAIMIFPLIGVFILLFIFPNLLNALPENYKLFLVIDAGISFAIGIFGIGIIFSLSSGIEIGLNIFKKLTSNIKLYSRYAVAKYEDIYLLTKDNAILLFAFTDEPYETNEKHRYPKNFGIWNKRVENVKVTTYRKEQDVVIPTVDGTLAGHAIIYAVPFYKKDIIETNVFSDPDTIKPIMTEIISKLKEDVKNYQMENP